MLGLPREKPSEQTCEGVCSKAMAWQSEAVA